MNAIGSIIVWAVFGLVVGAVARLLYPGRQSMGIFMTMVLGIVGSLVGGFISWMFNYDPQDGALQSSGFFMSVIGAIIVVWAGLAMSQRNANNSNTIV